MKTILVAGGAGYIGSHMVMKLLESGYHAIVADNLSTGHREAVKADRFYEGDIRDGVFLDRIFTENRIDGVINFAAFSLVGESCANPLKYYGNNLAGAQSILGAMKTHGVKSIVFSSTAAVYGEPERQPIREDDRTKPTNPYGESKLSIERLLHWCDAAYGIKYAALRYFNAAGADSENGLGEDHRPESHLIPLVLSVALNKRDAIGVFGDDYPTRDGTCVRDYIDVRDLAHAHLLAYEFLAREGKSDVFNLGNGSGFTVKEIIDVARRVTGHPIPARIEPRRAGDPSALVASNQKALEVLGWKPKHSELEDMIGSAWRFHREHPAGFRE
ncbi:MAG: UDP-glucose 4-epimerase GalE [Bacillota bacterium]